MENNTNTYTIMADTLELTLSGWVHHSYANPIRFTSINDAMDYVKTNLQDCSYSIAIFDVTKNEVAVWIQ